ncbi:MAG TPA: Uma2 family endonuclease, partial [Humisphaera sp.]|nr:Uma2 family endonuclease [Humisphaera sp.]
MTVATLETPVSPEDLLDLDSDLLYELVDGRLVEKKMSSKASETAGIVALELGIFLKKSHSGKLYPEQTFQCFPRYPGLIRRPDVAFVTAERLPGVAAEGHVRIAPDLAIEVVSPNDKVYVLDQKLAEYRDAGVKLIWVVNPNSRNIRVYRLDHTFAEFLENDTITGESVIPGFSILVRD